MKWQRNKQTAFSTTIVWIFMVCWNKLLVWLVWLFAHFFSPNSVQNSKTMQFNSYTTFFPTKSHFWKQIYKSRHKKLQPYFASINFSAAFIDLASIKRSDVGLYWHADSRKTLDLQSSQWWIDFFMSINYGLKDIHYFWLKGLEICQHAKQPGYTPQVRVRLFV